MAPATQSQVHERHLRAERQGEGPLEAYSKVSDASRLLVEHNRGVDPSIRESGALQSSPLLLADLVRQCQCDLEALRGHCEAAQIILDRLQSHALAVPSDHPGAPVGRPDAAAYPAPEDLESVEPAPTLQAYERLERDLQEARQESAVLFQQLHQVQEELEHVSALARELANAAEGPTPQRNVARFGWLGNAPVHSPRETAPPVAALSALPSGHPGRLGRLREILRRVLSLA